MKCEIHKQRTYAFWIWKVITVSNKIKFLKFRIDITTQFLSAIKIILLANAFRIWKVITVSNKIKFSKFRIDITTQFLSVIKIILLANGLEIKQLEYAQWKRVTTLIIELNSKAGAFETLKWKAYERVYKINPHTKSRELPSSWFHWTIYDGSERSRKRRRRTQFHDGLKNRRRYWELKEEADRKNETKSIKHNEEILVNFHGSANRQHI